MHFRLNRSARLDARIASVVRRQLDATLTGLVTQARAAIQDAVARAQDDIRTLAQAEASRIAGQADSAAAAIENLATSTRLRFEEHERILDAIRARWVDENTDLTDQEFLAHYNVGEVLNSLFTQRLRRLTGIRIRDERSRHVAPDALLREAELVRDMSRALFGAALPDFGALADLVTDGGRLEPSASDRRLLGQVERDVTELARAIRATGHEVAFVFDVPPGSQADPDRYELWTSSIPGRPVAFVVTPGYEAAGRRIRPPSVITTERMTGRG
jgi:flavin-binding protein dodecin